MTQVTRKNKSAIIISGVFIISCTLFFLLAKPIYNKKILIDQQIQNKIIFIQKYHELLNQKSYYKAKNNKNKSIHTALRQRFQNETKPLLAAASQQRLIEDLARETGLKIIRVRVDKPKYIENLMTISTQITTRSTLKNLTRFIHLLESNQKFMVIEEVSAQKSGRKDPEELQAQLTISGFIKMLKEEENKAI